MTDARERYDTWHEWAAQTYANDVDFEAPWHKAALPRLSHLVKERDVLEMACGRGAMAKYLSSLGPSSLSAGDFSPEAIVQARMLLADSAVEVSIQDIQRLTYASNSFDTVLSFETVEHVPSPRCAVAELARVLRPGGTLLLTTPNYFGIMGIFRGYKRVTGKPYTEVGQPINKLVMLPRTLSWVRNAGLIVKSWETTGQYLPWPGRVPITVPWLNRLGPLVSATGLHSLVVAEKPLA
jgi:2-polyprenyl-3-methyl-5-hydroxy-6-metoxy-1,4-benzoquinol methylase